MPTAVFDIVGTFFSLEPLRQRLTALGAPENALELWFAESLRDYFAVSHSGGYVPLQEILAAELPRTLAILGKGSQEPSRIELVLKGLRVLNPNDGALEAVTRFIRAGWKVIALTNGSEEHARTLLERAGIAGSFSAVLSADSVHHSKPHPDVYELARHELDGEGWLLSVHAWDVMGARRAGLHGAWVSKKEKRWLSAFDEPDLVAPDLATCARLLEERAQAEAHPAHH